ncbi:hypothetical protein NIES4101_53510 [Calothrix sp. NIES-4101]|nr:hypothetical protein NIES4101_53510 [Calothrix sp. NIES-4101]
MNLLELLAEFAKLKAQLNELTHRTYGLQIGVVTDNRDPLNLRRIKVAPQSKGGAYTSEWLMHCNPDPQRDAPLPPVGSTVFYQFLDGDPHDGVWLGIAHNQTNPSDPLQTDPTIDSAIEIPGNDRRSVAGEATYEVQGGRTEEVGKNYTLKISDEYQVEIGGEVEITAGDRITIKGIAVRLEDTTGAFIEVSGGAVRVGNAAGQDWQLGGGSGSAWQWDCAGSAIAVTAASGFSINGKQIAVIGAVDSDGDTIVNRGY